jgi:hypothetical protein
MMMHPLLSFEIPVHAAASCSHTQVTLVWVDPVASATSAKVVLHNLDLSVTSNKTGQTYFPNGRSGPDE